MTKLTVSGPQGRWAHGAHRILGYRFHVRVVGTEHQLAFGERSLKQRDRLGRTPRVSVCHREVVPGLQGAGVVGAQRPFAVGERLLVQRDRFGPPPCLPVGRREVVPRLQGVRWSAPGTRSPSASVRSNSEISSAVRPASR